MFWLHRPPYLRWLVAAMIVVAAVVWDLDTTRTEPHPFAARPLERGVLLTEGDVTWRNVPVGLLAQPDLSAAVPAVDVSAGEPIVPSLLGSHDPVPADWWAVAVPLPSGVPVGARVRLVVATGTVDGIVVTVAPDEIGSFATDGLVAVSPDHADAVARAVAEGDATVLVAP